MNQADGSCNSGKCDQVLEKVHELYHSLLEHDGFGELRLELRILKFGQKEVIIHCGKQYRYVVDFPGKARKKTSKAHHG